MKYAIKYYCTPEEIAEQVKTICDPLTPARGYRGNEYDNETRLDDIAAMCEALRDNIGHNEQLQLADPEQFGEVSRILEWDNYHTENIAFCLTFGDCSNVAQALYSVHNMGQSYAITRKLEYTHGRPCH